MVVCGRMRKPLSTVLPIHQKKKNRTGKKVDFEQLTRVNQTFGERAKWWWHKFTKASTGTLSDGFTDALSVVESEASSSIPVFVAHDASTTKEEDDDWVVNEVVVNGEEFGATKLLGSEKDTTTRQSPSDSGSVHGGPDSRFHSGGSNQGTPYSRGVWHTVRERMWPAVREFFEPSFESADQEADYQKMRWHSAKPVAFYSSIYLYLNWILYLILNHSESLYEKIIYYGGLSLVTFPIPFLVAGNLRVKNPVLFQICFCLAAWYCGITELIQMKQCDFFTHRKNCGKKDFLAMMFYTTALPTIYMFVVTKRLYNAIAQLVVFLLLMTLIIPDQGIYARNVLSFVIFSAFMQYLSWSLETTDRRMYLLNSQLKHAYRSQHKAQAAEMRASSAKRRFASYIFHEVRVPLNTAMLAFQNLEDDFKYLSEKNNGEQAPEIEAMYYSLQMMQTVLNDALDLDKMDAGRFESSQRPFPLHRTLLSTLRQTTIATSKKRIPLNLNFDPLLDRLPNAISNKELWVIGDDIRLRQVLSNLASNSVKFTPEGGGPITVTTRLIHPRSAVGSASQAGTPLADREVKEFIESSPLLGPNDKNSDALLVLRLEVQDSGPGIKPSDLQDTRLFQPFGQTPVGKATGKGSGLGLAIVRQIVHLSGGRLGIQSSKGNGAKFWVEMVYAIATKQALQTTQNDPAYSSPQFPVRPSSDVSRSESAEYSFSDGIELSLSSTAVPLLTPTSLMMDPLNGAKPSSSRTTSSQTMPLLAKAGPPTPSSLHIPDHPPPTSSKHPALMQEMPSVLPAFGVLARDPVLVPVLPTVPSLPESPAPPSDIILATTKAELPPPPVIDVGSPVVGPFGDEGTEPLQVLVVDDDPLTRMLMKKMLTKMGCSVDIAADGQQCLDMVTGPTPSGDPPKTYDFISLDNHMPVMTGEQAVSQLRALGRTDYVVGCTGNALSEDQQSYIKAGANQILTKPIMMKQLKAVIDLARQRRDAAPRPAPAVLAPPLPQPRATYPP